MKNTYRWVFLFILLLPGCTTDRTQRESSVNAKDELFAVTETVLDHLPAPDRGTVVISDIADPRWAIGRHVLVSSDFSRAAHVRLHQGRSWKYVLALTVIDPAVSVVVNGQDGPRFDYIKDVIFSPDGRHLAYVGAHGVDGTIPILGLYGGVTFETDKRCVLVVDDWQSDEYEGIENLRFNPEGSRLEYDVTRNGETLTLTCEPPAGDGPVPHPNHGRAESVQADPGSDPPRMTATGNDLVDQLEVLREKDDYIVVLNGARQGPFQEVVEVVWNAGHTRVAVLIRQSGGFWAGRHQLHVLTASADYGPYGLVGNLVWGPDDGHLVYVAGGREISLYVNGVQGPVVGAARDLWFGQRPHVPIEFLGTNHFQCAALRKNDVLRMDVEIVER